MSGPLEIIFRTLTAFIILWIFVHMLGKQTIFQKTYHLFIATITMGTIAGNLAFNHNISFLYFILAFAIMGTVIFTLNILSVKNHHLRALISGQPTTLIHEGKIMEGSLKKIGYSLDLLKQELRSKDIFNIEEVEWAILEVSGSLSVLKKAEYQYVTRKDLQLSLTPNKIPVELVINGKILLDSLTNSSYTEDWLQAELQKRNIKVPDILYAVVGTQGNLYIDLYQDHNMTQQS
ncbi:uncharacterized membrane protein YcaP (DUF421 family) [Bacillus sp. SORGH_AS 510]|uniref:DUF421 domain-containing protein n=1 Tax=Bacillus sp. SORGH_AS_0510 TaxID=3041771 RepID=UPI00277FE65B|nr:DUF421 domain-containing protein [Bacillus sp. SORGH_AS_0510]MDQ1147727.1 uncharacterized membrane protein YcaP (DUF421 family) [Bacillus sp. SORGH_AS_0510]